MILLPPSETKHAGGDGPGLTLDRLRLTSLTAIRERVIDALVRLSDSAEEAMRVLKLSERQRGDVQLNAALRHAPTMPAIDRYTGVLFDALDAASLGEPERAWIGEQVLVHSAPFGPVGALDAIPSYRLGATASLPGLPSLRKLWAPEVTSAWEREDPAFVLDLRSEAYVALGPLPPGVPSAYVRVVTAGSDGTVRALNHFNKKAKGDLVRQLARSRPDVSSATDVRAWAGSVGLRIEDGKPGELNLFVG